MANTLDDLMPKILARGLTRLRNRLVMPSAINRDYSSDAARRGSTIDVPVPPTVSSRAVSPGVTPVAADGITETTVPIALDQWYEAPIAFTDKDRLETIDESVVMAIDAAVDALAEQVNSSIFGLYEEVYEYVGTAATTPFASNYALATEARKILNTNKAPLALRRMIIDPDAEEKATNLSTFADSSFSGDNGVITEGDIGRKVGFDWIMDQQVPTHTTVAATSGTIALDDSEARPIGTKTLHMDGFSVEPAAGDVFTIAGDDQTYTVVSSTTLAGTDSDVTFEPGLKVAIPAADGDEDVTFKATHVANLALHRDAFAVAIRPFLQPASDARVMTMVDPATNLPLRLEVSRQNKQDYWSFDLLWGVKAVRPELAVRVAG